MGNFTRIKGVDKPQNITRLPRMGKIRLGRKRLSKKKAEIPYETDYFVCPPEVMAKYGEEPKELPVYLPTENEELYLKQYYACYGGNQRLKCQGDGDRADRRTEEGILNMPCPSPADCDFAKEHTCRPRTDLMVILPEVFCGGVYQISTGSINSDIDIRSGIEMAKLAFGRAYWVPMILKREAMKIADPNTGKMNTHYPVKLYPNATVETINQIRHDTKTIQPVYELPDPTIEGPESDPVVDGVIDEEDIKDETEPEKKLVDKYIDDIANAKDRLALEYVGKAIGEQKDAGLITAPEVEILTASYTKRKKELKK